MPAFTWFKADAPSQARRSNHFCQVIGNGQMLVLGGRDPSYNGTLKAGWTTVDPWTSSGMHGMNIFDMTAWAWTGSYSPSATYRRPTLVQQHYTNHANDTNWSDPALATLFVAKAATTATAGSNTPSTSHHSSTGAIAGGVVGGIAGLAIILAILFCLFRRRRRRRSSRRHGSHRLPPAESASAPLYEVPDQPKYELDEAPAKKRNPPVEMPANYDFGAAQKPLRLGKSEDHGMRQKPI